jgi:hypothetical protein
VKLNLALRELHRAERSLAADLRAVADRHVADHEVHHVALDLARWSDQHVSAIARAAADLGPRLSGEPRRAPEPVSELRRALGRLVGRRPEPGLLLLADLRRLHRAAAGVSVDWELLAQGAQAAKNTDLLALARRCHPETLRQLRWTNAQLKVLAPQILTS